MKKKCSKCGDFKIKDDFTIDKSKPDNRRSSCRKCNLTINSSEERKLKVKGYNKKKFEYKKERYNKILDYLGNKCYITEATNIKPNLHHFLPHGKRDNVSNMCADQRITFDEIIQEADKTIILNQGMHLALHAFLRTMKGKTDKTYLETIEGFKHLYSKLKKTLKQK